MSKKLFNERSLKKIILKINQYIEKFNSDYDSHFQEIENQHQEIISNIDHLTKAIEKGYITDSMLERMEVLEEERLQYEVKLKEIHPYIPLRYADFSYLIDEFHGLEQETESFRSFIQRYIVKITVFPYHLETERK